MYIKYEWQCFEFQVQEWVYSKKMKMAEKYEHQDYQKWWEKEYEMEDGEIKKKKRAISEDLLFFERAKELWYKCYVNLEAEVAHYWFQELLKMKTHFISNED